MADIAYSACCVDEVGASRVVNCAHTRLNPEASLFESNRADHPKISTMDGTPAANVGIHRDSMEIISDDRFAALSSIGGEYIGEDKLHLLKKKLTPICYVWFEPSDMMDIEQGIMKTIYVNKIVQAGCTVKILMADWFLQQHTKIGTDLNKIRDIGNFNIEMWKATGMDLDRVELVWLSDELNRHAVNYWPLAVDVSRKYSLEKMARCRLYFNLFNCKSFVVLRTNKFVYCLPSSYCRSRKCGPQGLPAAEIFYPCMQVAAILCQKADIWLFSMDQRDIVMLARDYAEDINREAKPAIILHNKLPLLPEDPDLGSVRYPARTLFMDDPEEASNWKIELAFCPPKVTVCNPFLEYIKYVIFPWFGIWVNWIYATTNFMSWRNAITKSKLGKMPLELSHTSIYAIVSNTRPYTNLIRSTTLSQLYTSLYGGASSTPCRRWRASSRGALLQQCRARLQPRRGPLQPTGVECLHPPVVHRAGVQMVVLSQREARGMGMWRSRRKTCSWSSSLGTGPRQGSSRRAFESSSGTLLGSCSNGVERLHQGAASNQHTRRPSAASAAAAGLMRVGPVVVRNRFEAEQIGQGWGIGN